MIETEHGTFNPLVFGTNGAMGRECQLFHKKLAKKLSQKQNRKYHEVIMDIRTKISFKLLKSILLCLRGSRTVFQFVDNVRLYLGVWFLYISF